MNGEIDLREFAQQMLDHFGTLEAQEMAVKEAFQRLDKDGNGYIDRHELRFIMSKLGESPGEEDICEMFRLADLNGDGLIDYEGERVCL